MATWQFLIFVTVTKSENGPPTPSTTGTPGCKLYCDGVNQDLGSGNTFNVKQGDNIIFQSTGYYQGAELMQNVIPNSGITIPPTRTLPPGLFSTLLESEPGGMSTVLFGKFSDTISSNYPSFTINGVVGDPANGGVLIGWTVDPKISITAP